MEIECSPLVRHVVATRSLVPSCHCTALPPVKRPFDRWHGAHLKAQSWLISRVQTIYTFADGTPRAPDSASGRNSSVNCNNQLSRRWLRRHSPVFTSRGTRSARLRIAAGLCHVANNKAPHNHISVHMEAHNDREAARIAHGARYC